MTSEPTLKPVIIGVGCRLPGAASPETFWQMLCDRRVAVAPLPRERFDLDVYGSEMPRVSVAMGGVLGDFKLDFRAMRLPPIDAEKMHRVERAALDACGQALQDAALLADGRVRARTRVYLASSTLGPDPLTDHSPRIRRHQLQEPVSAALALELPSRQEEIDDILTALFNLAAPPVEQESLRATAALLAGRIASIADVVGGHASIDAGFSSSVAALEQACAAIETGLCDCAIVCAVSPLITPVSVVTWAHRGYLASAAPMPFSSFASSRENDGAANAGGTALGEGAVALVIARSDLVPSGAGYAVVEGAATAFAGRDPTADQLRLAVGHAAHVALARAGAAVGQVRAIESRASGIAAQDEPEIAGLASAYGDAARGADAAAHPAHPAHPVQPLTSTVANIGLLPACGGLVSVLRAALALKRQHVPPHAYTLRSTQLSVLAEPLLLDNEMRIAISDAGVADVVGHAVLASVARAEPGPAPRRATATANVIANVTANAGSAVRSRHRDDIAVVGVGVVAPQAPDVQTYWNNVLGRVDAVGDLPLSRFDVDKLVNASQDISAYLRTRLAATVDLPQPDLSAGTTDPAVALSIEAAQQALLDAGELLRSEVDAGQARPRWDPTRVGVMFGQLPFRWREMELELRVLFAGHLRLTQEAMREAGVDAETTARVIDSARMNFFGVHGFAERGNRASGPAEAMMRASSADAFTSLTCPAAIADRWGFRGPVLAVDAACASSLAAVEAGVEALRRGDIDVAVCGGVAFNLLPEYYLALSVLGVLSQRGEPPFSQKAEGFVPGEGAGCIVLMRHRDAKEQSRRVRAVLRGIGVSSDGRGPSVFAPRTAGQTRAIERALHDAGVSADSIDLVEAHGTGTRVGDETELTSYAAAYGKRDRSRALTIGSVKSQIGHLSSAAGALGMIKAVLALETHTLPPSLLDVDALSLTVAAPIELATVTRPWASLAGRPRRAGVSSFGLGGVNYHAILEEPVNDPAEALGPSLSPARGPRADRFEVALAPVALPQRAKQFPVNGKRVVLIPPPSDVPPAKSASTAVTDAFEAELRRRGADVVVIAPATPTTTGAERQVEVTRVAVPSPSSSSPSPSPATGRVDLIVDLSATTPHADPFVEPASFLRHATGVLSASLGALRAIYAEASDAASDGAKEGAKEGVGAPRRGIGYVAVTALGDLGLTGAPPKRTTGAALLGLMKGAKVELPQLLARGVDVDPQLIEGDLVRAAQLVLDEVEDGNDRMEVAYSASGGRCVMNLERRSHDDSEKPARPIEKGDVWLFSGGGRGIVFECALALAREGARVIVSGRTPAPSPHDPLVNMDDDSFAEYRKSELLLRRTTDRSLTPAAFAKAFEPVEKARELGRNLSRAHALGVSLEYVVADVNDARSVADLVAQVRSRYGPIGGVVHGAMVEWSTSIPRKTDTIAADTLATKVAGFVHLVRALADAPPHTFCSFSSGAGRFGNAGQADYSGANNLLCALTASAAAQLGSSTRFFSIDWTAWADVGAAVRNADMVKNLGLTTIKPVEGCYWFASEIARGNAREVIIFEEAMLDHLPFLGDTPEGDGARAVVTDDVGAPLVQGHWPLVDFVIERSASSLVFERRLDVERDRFLAEHRLNGVPILPATFGCELVAEAASLMCPGYVLDSILDMVIDVPVKVPRGGVTLRVAVHRIGTVGDRVVVDAECTSDLVLHGKTLQKGRVHHRARVVMRPSDAQETKILLLPDLPSFERARSFFHLTQEPVALGPLFCRARWIRIVDREVTGHIMPPRLRDIVARSAWPRFQVDPLTLDAAFQVAANWDGCNYTNVSIPVAVGAVHVARQRRRGEHARAWARVVRVEDPVVTYDIDVVGENDELLLEIRSVRLHRIARVNGDAAGPEI